MTWLGSMKILSTKVAKNICRRPWASRKVSLRGRLYGANKGLVKRCFDSPRAARVLIPEPRSCAVTVLAGPAVPTSLTGITASSGTFQGLFCHLWPSQPASQHLMLRRFLFKHVGAGVKKKAGFQRQSVPLSDHPIFFLI